MAQADSARLLEVIEQLARELRVGGGRPVRLDSNLRQEVGLDSLGVVELYDRVEEAFGVHLDEEVLATASTPAEWLEAISRERHATEAALRPAVERPVARERARGWPSHATTVSEALAWHAEAHPELVCVHLLATNAPAEAVTYGELAADARRLGRALAARGVAQGDRVAIMLPTSRDYLRIFLGILEAGAVPVPVYPPPSRTVVEEHLRRATRVLASARAVMLVTLPEVRRLAWFLQGEVAGLRSVELVESLLARGEGGLGVPVHRAGDDLALVQYTSGSTGDPKGVTLTHAQLLANITAMGEAAKVSTDDVFVSWLPLYHDMGLIAAFLAPLYFGFPLVLMSPLQFLARPASWLEAISAYGGTISAAPDFAYLACVERIRPSLDASFDLSSWRLAFDGSEPVAARTLERFVARFERRGFRPEALCPAYGLAEAGVGVTFTPLGRRARLDYVDAAILRRWHEAVPVEQEAPSARAIVSCGVPLPGIEVRVVDERDEQLAERHEGSVLVRGPSVTNGYLGDEAATAAALRDGWLVTGDTGYLADGELYLTGRSKDVVIRGGRNFYPAELEEQLRDLEGVSNRGVIAFAARDERRSTERLVVAIETSLSSQDEKDALIAEVRRSAAALEMPVEEVVLVRPGALARTPSGKLRREAIRVSYEKGLLGRPPAPFLVQVGRVAASAIGARWRRLLSEGAALRRAGRIWLAAGVCALVAWVVVMAPLALEVRWRALRKIGYLLARLGHVSIRVEGDVGGLARPSVIVANHASFVDGLVVMLAMPEPVAIVTSVELEQTPLVGGFLRRLGCVFVERGRPERASAALEALEQVVRRGGRLAVFPEGSLSAEPTLRAFHLGAFVVAARAGCPVVPLAIKGTRDVLSPGSYLPRSAEVKVEIGASIEPGGEGFDAALSLRDAARAWLEEALGAHGRKEGGWRG
jgi:1-acyl-sn-glycerol-3-phosphate acyltransferase